MKKNNVLIYPAAIRDLQEIVDYINEQSLFDNFKLYDDITSQIAALAEMPFRYPLARRLKGYHVLPVHSYLVFYVVNQDQVQIRRILHAKRQYDTLL